jgi:hypothetical protein
MDLPDRDKHAPQGPEDRTAFLRALDLAEHFAELAWILSNVLASDIEDTARSGELEVSAASMDWGRRDAARLEVEASMRLLASHETMDRVVETAIIEAVRRCAARIVSWAPHQEGDEDARQAARQAWKEKETQEKKAALAELRRLHDPAGRIKQEAFSAAVDEWVAVRQHRQADEEEASFKGRHWEVTAKVIAQALGRPEHQGSIQVQRIIWKITRMDNRWKRRVLTARRGK